MFTWGCWGEPPIGATTYQPPLGPGHHHRKISQDSTGSSSVGVVKEVNVGNEFVVEAPVFGGFKEEDATLRCGENSIARKVDSEFGDDEMRMTEFTLLILFTERLAMVTVNMININRL